MANQSFSKIGIVVILAVFIVGGIFAWQYFGPSKEATKNLTPEQEEALQKNIEQAGIRERDAKRIGDVAMIRTALQLYSDDHQDYYPAVIYGEMANLFLGYLGNKDLRDPLTNEPYLYYSCPPQGKDYHLGVKLEDKNSSYLAQDADASKCGPADFSGEDPIYDISTSQTAPVAEGSGGVIEDETAGWKTYRNEEYGYEVKYPNDWINFGELLGGFNITSPIINGKADNRIQVIPNKREGSESNREYIDNMIEGNTMPGYNELNRKKEITINGIKGYEIVWNMLNSETKQLEEGSLYIWLEAPATSKARFIVFRFDGKGSQYPVNFQTFNQMFSTFRFLE